MQLYHHPLSIDSQRVRLALEENDIDYTSYRLNPLTGKNLNPSFFRLNPTGKLPVFQNGSHITIYNTIEIIQYIERIAAVSSGGGRADETGCRLSSLEATQWMQKILKWNPKYFTLAHIPEDRLLFVAKFLRRVTIARMSEAPDLANSYHQKLKEAYETEERLKHPEMVRESKEQLVKLLDEVEERLKDNRLYLAGDEFSMADVMLIPVLARLEVLRMDEEYVGECRGNLAGYWKRVKQRPSYWKVIGRYFDGWRRRKTLLKAWCFIRVRSLIRRY